jgi:hypothetical protein
MAHHKRPGAPGPMAFAAPLEVTETRYCVRLRSRGTNVSCVKDVEFANNQNPSKPTPYIVRCFDNRQNAQSLQDDFQACGGQVSTEVVES